MLRDEASIGAVGGVARVVSATESKAVTPGFGRGFFLRERAESIVAQQSYSRRVFLFQSIGSILVVTKPKDLRSGHSIWEGRSGVAHRPLTRDVEVDVLLIGAGITGAMIADALDLSGFKVAIADKRGVAKGSTTASTALVQFEIDTPLTKLTRKIGKADAVRAWRRTRLAVDALAARFRELDVPDVVQRDSLYLAGDMLHGDALTREHEARRAVGLASHYLDRKTLRVRFGLTRQAALLGYGNLTIDHRKATLAFLRAATSHKTKIFAPVEIVDIQTKQAGITATAADGKHIHCRYLVFATGYELSDRVPRRG